MWKMIKEILIVSFIFLALDAVWIGLIMKDHFSTLVLNIQKSDLEFSILPALLCYFVLIGGLYNFVIRSMKNEFDILHIISLSIPFGLCVYGTYDFTNASIFKNWDMKTALIDIVWGTFLSTVSAISIGFYREKFESRENEEHLGNSSKNSLIF